MDLTIHAVVGNRVQKDRKTLISIVTLKVTNEYDAFGCIITYNEVQLKKLIICLIRLQNAVILFALTTGKLIP